MNQPGVIHDLWFYVVFYLTLLKHTAFFTDHGIPDQMQKFMPLGRRTSFKEQPMTPWPPANTDHLLIRQRLFGSNIWNQTITEAVTAASYRGTQEWNMSFNKVNDHRLASFLNCNEDRPLCLHNVTVKSNLVTTCLSGHLSNLALLLLLSIDDKKDE